MYQRRFGYVVPALMVTVFAAIVFAALAWSVHEHNEVADYDEEIAKAMEADRLANPELQKIMTKVTNVGSPETLFVVAFVATVALLRLRRLWLSVIWVLLIAGGDHLNKVIKDVFERPRPAMTDLVPKPGQAPSWSFPSGHAMDSMIGYGMLVYVLWLTVPRPWFRMVLVLLLVVLIGFSRVYLNAHYPSDVLAGFAAGMVVLGLGIAIIEVFRS